MTTKYLFGFLAIGTIACALVPLCVAQSAGNVPPIRVESREVLVPVAVFAKSNAWAVSHLGVSDFHLFEDGKEQRIQDVTRAKIHVTAFEDNLGAQQEYAHTRVGKWARSTPLLGLDTRRYGFHFIAYVPPPAAPGTCHQIKVKVAGRSPVGSAFVTAEAYSEAKGSRLDRTQVDRSDLVLYYRSEYCSTADAALDPLNGTKLSKRMEEFAASNKATQTGLSVQAISFYGGSGTGRAHVALDFPIPRKKSGLPAFPISILAMIYKKGEGLKARFSDTSDVGCWVVSNADSDPTISPTVAQYCREFIPNHYEAQLELAPGEYDLLVVMDYDGVLKRAEVPIVVDKYDARQLGISGIALCKRFHPPAEPQATDDVPTLPFEFVPMVSKGIEFTPTGDTCFKKGELLVAYFEAYEPALAGTPAEKVQFEMKVTDMKTGELKSDTGLRLADSFVQPGKTTIPIAEQVAVDRLPSGSYRLEVQASDSAGNHTDWRATSFTVE